MVSIKLQDLLWAIKVTKMRIKHHEKHGCGTNTMNDKTALKYQERKLELRKQKGYDTT